MLASLKAEYGGARETGGGAATERRRNKEAKRWKRMEDEWGAGNDSEGGSGSDGGVHTNRVRLPQNRVEGGHARKMREAKDLRSKSAANMAAVFGVKTDFYHQPRE